MRAMDYKLHLRITTVGSPSSGQPHAGGPGAGDVIVDQVLDLKDWVAARGGLADVVIGPLAGPVVSAPMPAAVVAPTPKPVVVQNATIVPPAVPAPTPVTPAPKPVVIPAPSATTASSSAEKSYGSFGSDR
jgi:hypothetical protein